MSIEERIRKLEERIESLAKLLEELRRIAEGDPEARAVIAIALRALSYNRNALGIARWVLDAERKLKSLGLADDISRAVIEVLATRGPMNISQITRAVRELRGRASRRIVAERLKRLLEVGLVELLSSGRGKVYKIRGEI